MRISPGHDLGIFPPVDFFLASEPVQTTVIANAVMAAYCSAATGACPLLFLCSKEFIYAVIFDGIQIVYHAHVVAGAVALVNSAQVGAGEVSTFKTVGHLLFPQWSAALSQVSTSFIPGAAAGAVGNPDSFALDVIRAGKVTGAESAVHAAGCN